LTEWRHLYHPWYGEGMTQSAPRRPSFDRSDREHYDTPYPASTRALAYWESLRDDLLPLVVEAGNAGIGTEWVRIPGERDELTASVCSAEIDEMKETITTLRAQLRSERRSGTRSAAAQLEADRLYQTPDGEIYRTMMSGAGNLYAKIWTTDGWDYAAGAIRDLRPEHRMTRERAIELSVRFGRCVRCYRVLTAEQSVEQGIGPICINKI
jgi:hypothetical protein